MPLFLQIGTQLMSIHSAPCFAEAIVKHAIEVTCALLPKHECVAIAYRDFDYSNIYMQSSTQSGEVRDVDALLASGEGIIKRCLQTKTMQSLSSWNPSNQGFISRLEVTLGLTLDSRIHCLPLLIEDQCHGAILFCSTPVKPSSPTSPSFFSFSPSSSYQQFANQPPILDLIAGNTAVALQRCYERCSADLFLQIGEFHLAEFQFSEIVNTFVEYIQQLTFSESATIYFCDHIHQEIWYVSKEGFHGNFGNGIVGKVAVSCRPLSMPSADIPRIEGSQEDGSIRSMICVPVLGYGQEECNAIAVLQAVNKKSGSRFTAADEAILVKLAFEVSRTFHKRILDVRYFSLTNRQKEQYLQEGFLKEYGLDPSKKAFANRFHRTMSDRSKSSRPSSAYSSPVKPLPPKPFSYRGDSYRKAADSYRMASRMSEESLDQYTDMRNISMSSEGYHPRRSSAKKLSVERRGSEVMKMSDSINQWDLDPFLLNEQQVMECITEIFKQSELFDIFSIDDTTFRNFIKAIRSSYHANDFHNFLHAFSVLHLSYQISQFGPKEFLEPIDVLGLFICALCHDLDHPGNTKYVPNTLFAFTFANN